MFKIKNVKQWYKESFSGVSELLQRKRGFASERFKEIIWLNRLLNETTNVVDAISSHGQASSITLMKNPEYHKRLKYIEVRDRSMRTKFNAGKMYVEYIDCENQITDTMPKSLEQICFETL